MPPLLAVTLPFFALVLCGWLAGRFRVLPEAAIPGLNAFVLFFALPCMLFRFGAASPVEAVFNPRALLLYTACGLLIVALTALMSRRGWIGRRLGWKDAAFGAFVAAFPNTGFMGMPLMVALLGPAAAAPMMVTLLADMFIISGVCLALAQMQGSGHLPWAQRLRTLMAGPLKNPQPWAIALGALFSAMGWALPAPAARIVELLGGAATPVALFTIGAVLWRSGLHAHKRTPPAEVLPIAAIKLFVHPALMFGGGLALAAAGWPLEAFTLMVLTLAAALPSASNASLLAERHGADNGRVARIILASTVLAFASFTGLAAVFGVEPVAP
ncbi:AEC family transporter [Piscinibacter sp. Jin2]|uniref:AEC family transporter n=1 Tax=Aquariibacter lacus TaxID=2801332 RepID=A0A9X0XDY5_9BURK|nr:AEC family transporter [Piscinibacter lacus]MBL0719077.1 AEC family transporter [Piscinibacter lacus]